MFGQERKVRRATDKEVESLKEELNSIEKVKVHEVSTRVVRLKYKSCCGCGCDTVDIIRVVPMDSKLHDGDRADRLLAGDKQE